MSRYGLIPLVNSMDVPGILARRVADVADVFGTYTADRFGGKVNETCVKLYGAIFAQALYEEEMS